MACNCTYYDIIIQQSDLDNATGNSNPPFDNTVYIDYIDCNGNNQTVTKGVAGTYNNDICVTATSSPSVYIYINNLLSLASGGSVATNTTTDCCPTPTPTSTIPETPTPTPTIFSIQCDDYLNNQGTPLTGINFTDCDNNVQTNVTVNPGQSICVQQGTLSGGGSGFLTNLGSCGVYPPITTQTPTPTETPTQTPTPTVTQTTTQTSTVPATPTTTPTPSVTPSITPTITNIICGEGITTSSVWYYTSCCGTFVEGTGVGVSVIFDYGASFVGINKTFVPVSVICPSPSTTPSNTPTPTVTSGLTPSATPTTTTTPTTTPTPSKTPGISPVYRLANNCETFTSFPLGVSCQTITQPTGDSGLNGSLRIRISGGTPPYSIYWSNGAKSQILTGLNPGSYEAIVTDFYGDYTATTICSLVAVSPTPTTTLTPTVTPTPSPVYSSLCLLLLSNTTSFTPLQFVFSGIINNKPSWTSGSYVMAWSNTTNRWEVQGYTVFGGLLVSTTTSSPPLSNWTLVGGTQAVTVNVVTGTCPAYPPFNTTITKSDSNCTNNGSITITTSGGVPPYLYSNNGGTTFQSSNIFNNLSPQTYSVISKDSVNNQTTNSIVIALVGSTQTYTLSITNTLTQNLAGGSLRRAYWNVSVSPALPVGVTIPFTLNVESIQSVGGPGTGNISSTSQVYSLNTIINPTTTSQNTVSSVRIGCSPETTSTTTVIQQFNLTLSSTNSISGVTTSNLDITDPQVGLNGCVTTLSQNIRLFLTQATANGCTCCVANFDPNVSAGITSHTLEAGQGTGNQIYYPMIIGLGTSAAAVCSDLIPGTTRLINSATFGPGVTVFTGSPNNPQIAVGYTFVSDSSGFVYTMLDGVVGTPTGDAC